MSRNIALVFGLVLATLGCTQPSHVFDTTGAVFGWNHKEGYWWLEVLDETPPPPPCNGESKAIYTILHDRFITFTSACTFADGSGGWSSTTGDDRYLACDVDGDCPQFNYPKNPELYECSAGLCQNLDLERYPRDELRRYVAEPLCVADLERPDFPQEIVELLDEHCGPDARDLCPLPLPEPCWTP